MQMLSPPLSLSQRFSFLYPPSLSRHILHYYPSKRKIWSCLSQCQNSPNSFLLSVGSQNSPLLQLLCYAVPTAPQKTLVPLHILFHSQKSYPPPVLCANTRKRLLIFQDLHDKFSLQYHLPRCPCPSLRLSLSLSHSLPFSYSSHILTNQISSYHDPLWKCLRWHWFHSTTTVHMHVRVHTHAYFAWLFSHMSTYGTGSQSPRGQGVYRIPFISSTISWKMFRMNLRCSNIFMCSYFLRQVKFNKYFIGISQCLRKKILERENVFLTLCYSGRIQVHFLLWQFWNQSLCGVIDLTSMSNELRIPSSPAILMLKRTCENSTKNCTLGLWKIGQYTWIMANAISIYCLPTFWWSCISYIRNMLLDKLNYLH